MDKATNISDIGYISLKLYIDLEAGPCSNHDVTSVVAILN